MTSKGFEIPGRINERDNSGQRGKWCSCFRVMNVQDRKGLGISQRDMNGMYAEGLFNKSHF